MCSVIFQRHLPHVLISSNKPTVASTSTPVSISSWHHKNRGLTPGTVRKCFKTPSVIDEEAAKTLDGMRTFDSDSTISFNKLPSVAALVNARANVSVSFSSSSLADTNTFSLSSTPSARNHVFTLAALSLISATFSTLLKSLFCNATSFLL